MHLTCGIQARFIAVFYTQALSPLRAFPTPAHKQVIQPLGVHMAKSIPFLFQAKSGHIRLGYGFTSTILTREQIDELHIDCYSLSDFSHDDFVKAYSTPNKACSRQEPAGASESQVACGSCG